MILDFSKCKTPEDVDRIIEESGLKTTIDAINTAHKKIAMLKSLKDFPWRSVKNDFNNVTFECGCKRHRLGRCECGKTAYLCNFDGSPK